MTDLYAVSPSLALGSKISLGSLLSSAAGADTAPSDPLADGWPISGDQAEHVLDTIEVYAHDWEDIAGDPEPAASTILCELWMCDGEHWACIGVYTLGNAAAIAAVPTVIGGKAEGHFRSAMRYGLRLDDISVADHVTVSVKFTGGTPV
jgi:hypothetical protein